jgi:thymidine phosphorylase
MMKMNTISRRENWHPMTEQEAIAIVEDMRRDTEKNAQIALFEMAAQMPQNFTPESAAIYAARLSELI